MDEGHPGVKRHEQPYAGPDGQARLVETGQVGEGSGFPEDPEVVRGREGLGPRQAGHSRHKTEEEEHHAATAEI